MDLFSAARRLSNPFVFQPNDRHTARAIGAHGVIGDGYSCALVAADGAIDWLCFPRFDSPSVFAALLDGEKGGFTSVQPADVGFETLQRYDPDTNVLETLFRVEGQGVFRLTDFMPWTNDPRASIHEVHRRIDCLEGQVRIKIIVDPRFEYGAHTPNLIPYEDGVLAEGHNHEKLVFVVSGNPRWINRAQGGVETELTLRSGTRRWMVFSWGAPRPEHISSYRSFEHLRATRHAWREWARQLRYDGPWRHHVLRSALVLKLMQYAPTGAMIAAPTTSLPEWMGGQRNWDYRYAWTRDSAMAVRAANLMGYLSEARDFFHFIRDVIDSGVGLRVMYAVDGTLVPDERVLSHLKGHRNSRPVRIGNAARDQMQLDTAGELLDSAYLYEQVGGVLTLRAWRNLRDIADGLCKIWEQPDDGIWEPRVGRRHNVHSKLMSWLALHRAESLSQRFSAPEAGARWNEAAKRVREDVMAKGLDASKSRFVNAYGHDDPDAALLLMPIHGFLPPDHPLSRRTVQWIEDTLHAGPYLYRYCNDDGLPPGEGAFVLCGFWLAETMALEGRLDEAQRTFMAHAEASNHLGLMAEEINPTTNELLGNFPQAFSHLGLINAAERIDLALRLRDEGSNALPRFSRATFEPGRSG